MLAHATVPVTGFAKLQPLETIYIYAWATFCVDRPLVFQFPARSLKLSHQVPLLPCREQIWTFLSHALFKVA